MTRAHDRAMQLLEGDGLAHGISVVNGEVSINFLPLVSRGLQELSDLGVPGLDKIPELTPDGDPSQQIAQLEEATGRDLPDDFGQLVVYRSDRLANAQDAVSQCAAAPRGGQAGVLVVDRAHDRVPRREHPARP